MKNVVQWKFNSRVDEVRTTITEACSCLHDKQNEGYACLVDDYYFRLVVDEALDNALNHGNIKDPDKSIILKLEFFDEYINITVWDEGKGFTPESIDNPCDEKNRFKRRGRGIHIIKAMGITHWEEKGRCISIRLNGDS